MPPVFHSRPNSSFFFLFSHHLFHFLPIPVTFSVSSLPCNGGSVSGVQYSEGVPFLVCSVWTTAREVKNGGWDRLREAFNCGTIGGQATFLVGSGQPVGLLASQSEPGHSGPGQASLRVAVLFVQLLSFRAGFVLLLRRWCCLRLVTRWVLLLVSYLLWQCNKKVWIVFFFSLNSFGFTSVQRGESGVDFLGSLAR